MPWSSTKDSSAKLNGATFYWNFPRGVMNVLFFATSGDNLSLWNAPVQSKVDRYLFPLMVSTFSLILGKVCWFLFLSINFLLCHSSSNLKDLSLTVNWNIPLQNGGVARSFLPWGIKWQTVLELPGHWIERIRARKDKIWTGFRQQRIDSIALALEKSCKDATTAQPASKKNSLGASCKLPTWLPWDLLDGGQSQNSFRLAQSRKRLARPYAMRL